MFKILSTEENPDAECRYLYLSVIKHEKYMYYAIKSYQTQLHLIANGIKLLQALVKSLQRNVAAFPKSQQSV